VPLLDQALLPLPGLATAVFQPCCPPPPFHDVAEWAVVARGQRLLGGLTQLLLVPLAVGGWQVRAGVVDPFADV
jgi:hypothetical protein